MSTLLGLLLALTFTSIDLVGTQQANATQNIKRYLPLSPDLLKIDTCRDDFLDPERDGFSEYLTYTDARQSLNAPKQVKLSTYFTQSCRGSKDHYTVELALLNKVGDVQVLNPTRSYSYERDDYLYYDDPTECGRYVLSCWSHSRDYTINFQSLPGTHSQVREAFSLRVSVFYEDYVCESEEGAAGRVSVCSNVPRSVSQTMSDFFIVTFPPNPLQESEDQPNEVTDESEAPEKDSQSVIDENSVSEKKVNAGSFKGYVALYVKGYQGSRFSAKVGNDWVVVPEVKSSFERYVEFTGAGYQINVRMFIDRVLTESVNLVTK